MATKTNEELKKDQEIKVEDNQEKNNEETEPETKGKKAKKKEREPWGTKKKVGVVGTILLAAFGIGYELKKRFFGGEDDENEGSDE